MVKWQRDLPVTQHIGNTLAIKKYIEGQLKRDRESDQLIKYDPRDPFMGSKYPDAWLAGHPKAHLCAACCIRAMPESEEPPAMPGDIYLDRILYQ